MKMYKIQSKIYFLCVYFILALLIISCENNPVYKSKDSDIVFDYIDFNIEITDKTDSTCTINLNASVIYHPENSGFQIMGDGYHFYNSSRTSGFGRIGYFETSEFLSPRGRNDGSLFINSEEIDTLLYEAQYTNKEMGFYTIFEYQLFGIFTDTPFEPDFDTLATKSYYYCLVDTLIY